MDYLESIQRQVVVTRSHTLPSNDGEGLDNENQR